MKKQYDERSKRNVRSSRTDSTRISRVSKNQLAFLWNKTGEQTVDARGLPPGYEDFFCFVPSVSKTQHGYPYVTLAKYERSFDDNLNIRRDQRFLCSHIALAIDEKHAADKKHDASHLCDNPKCVRSSHLCWEEHTYNLSRVKCFATIVCPCGTVHNICEHVPKCKKIKILP